MRSFPKSSGPTGPDTDRPSDSSSASHRPFNQAEPLRVCETGRELAARDGRFADRRPLHPGLAKQIQARIRAGFYGTREVIDAMALRILGSNDL